MPKPHLSTLLLFALVFGKSPANAQSTPPQQPARQAPMTQHASGPFDVKISPQPLTDTTADPKLSRMSIDKQFHGDLEATSKGEMLSAMTDTKGSAGYVAIERVTGTLGGHTGSFVLQHTATMNRGTPQLSITVVPDSRTGQLTGLTGTMNVIIKDGKHTYVFDYALPVQP